MHLMFSFTESMYVKIYNKALFTDRWSQWWSTEKHEIKYTTIKYNKTYVYIYH